jgi:hypothetical protein
MAAAAGKKIASKGAAPEKALPIRHSTNVSVSVTFKQLSLNFGAGETESNTEVVMK